VFVNCDEINTAQSVYNLPVSYELFYAFFALGMKNYINMGRW
jgi:hypothetical protein